MNRITFILLFVGSLSQAQDGHYSLGARNSGTAGASVTNTDCPSLFNNIGSLGSIEQTGGFISYQNRYALKNLQIIGGGFILHSPLLNAGIKYFKFGDDFFSQQLVGIAFANRFQKVSIGIGINVLQTSAEGQETDRVIALELGGRAEITPHLLFGAHLFNIRHSQPYPTTLKMGLSFLPVESVQLHMEVEKQLDFPERMKFGIEYRVIEILVLRTGLHSQRNPTSQHQVTSALGMGFTSGSFQVDYSFQAASDLGSIHELSLTYQIEEK